MQICLDIQKHFQRSPKFVNTWQGENFVHIAVRECVSTFNLFLVDEKIKF